MTTGLNFDFVDNDLNLGYLEIITEHICDFERLFEENERKFNKYDNKCEENICENIIQNDEQNSRSDNSPEVAEEEEAAIDYADVSRYLTFDDVLIYLTSRMIDGKRFYRCNWKGCVFHEIKNRHYVCNHIRLTHLGAKHLMCSEHNCFQQFRFLRKLWKHQKSHKKAKPETKKKSKKSA